MRELHGVLAVDRLKSVEDLKRYLIYFDHIRFATSRLFNPHDEMLPNLVYLQERGVIHSGPSNQLLDDFDARELPLSPSIREIVRNDIIVRHVVRRMARDDYDVVGIYDVMPWIGEHEGDRTKQHSIETALTVGFTALPIPDETCAFEDIMNFKDQLRDQQWNFRRFLHTLATKNQTESEIRDDIEWSLNEYTKAMERFKLRRSVSFMEAYIVPTVEVLENFKASSFLKGLVAIKKRKVELFEAEANAKGCECAYVFEALKRFGGK
jgi:hypothetical protein